MLHIRDMVDDKSRRLARAEERKTRWRTLVVIPNDQDKTNKHTQVVRQLVRAQQEGTWIQDTTAGCMGNERNERNGGEGGEGGVKHT